jgi:hypothetical protein
MTMYSSMTVIMRTKRVRESQVKNQDQRRKVRKSQRKKWRMEK